MPTAGMIVIAVLISDIAVEVAQANAEMVDLAMLPTADCCLQGGCGTDTMQEESKGWMRMRRDMFFYLDRDLNESQQDADHQQTLYVTFTKHNICIQNRSHTLCTSSISFTCAVKIAERSVYGTRQGDTLILHGIWRPFTPQQSSGADHTNKEIDFVKINISAFSTWKRSRIRKTIRQPSVKRCPTNNKLHTVKTHLNAAGSSVRRALRRFDTIACGDCHLADNPSRIKRDMVRCIAR